MVKIFKLEVENARNNKLLRRLPTKSGMFQAQIYRSRLNQRFLSILHNPADTGVDYAPQVRVYFLRLSQALRRD